jgi:two-component system chemotaxis response regulator CheB
MSRCNVIVLGASAGGVTALGQLVSRLPADFPAAVAVALHVPERSPSVLPGILSRHGALPAAHATDGAPLLHGRIYVAPPGRHLLIKRRTIRAVAGPHENGHRPAIDPLFRTAARAHGRHVIGVVLSGSLDDGTAGLAAIKAHGGAALVQDPAEAMFSGMPASAIENVEIDLVADVEGIAREVVRRVHALTSDPEPHQDDGGNGDGEELDAVELDRGIPKTANWPEAPSAFTCPDCHGSLFELRDGSVTHFRCRTRHAYSPAALADAQEHGIEEALWIALRALEENADLLHRLQRRAHGRGQARAADRFLAQARHVEARAAIVRDALVRGNGREVMA